MNRKGQGRRKPDAEARSRDKIFVPPAARSWRLSALVIPSPRLRRVFEFNEWRLLGDLHGRSFAEFRAYRNCGTLTLTALREFIGVIQRSPPIPGDQIPGELVVPDRLRGTIFVPARLRAFKVADLPLSRRLEGVLRRRKVTCLSDLHGRTLRELRYTRNCGDKTIAEMVDLIARAAAGEFSVPAGAVGNPGELVRALDALVSAVPAKQREVLLLRLGGSGAEQPTLAAVGAKFRFTRERVRQIVDEGVEHIRRHGSLPLRHEVEGVERFCREKVCPLTPALLGQWLKNAGTSARFSGAFYTRLLGELTPAIPVWPTGQDSWGRRDERSKRMEAALEALLRAGGPTLPFADAAERLRATAGWQQLEATEFLGMLRCSRCLKVEFPRPDAPVVTLVRRRIPLHVAARLVLQASDKPLTPEEILARARALFGSESGTWSPRSVTNTLTVRPGFYLVAYNTFGQRRHFSVPEKQWPQIQAAFRKRLRQEKRPISAVEIAGARKFAWATKINSRELRCILRQDRRLVDLGKFLFALAEWGIERRENLKDLIPRLLEQAARPLTKRELWERVRRVRSVSRSCFRYLLRTHPAIGDYGVEGYGLKSWAGDQEAVRTGGELVQRYGEEGRVNN